MCWLAWPEARSHDASSTGSNSRFVSPSSLMEVHYFRLLVDSEDETLYIVIEIIQGTQMTFMFDMSTVSWSQSRQESSKPTLALELMYR